MSRQIKHETVTILHYDSMTEVRVVFKKSSLSLKRSGFFKLGRRRTSLWWLMVAHQPSGAEVRGSNPASSTMILMRYCGATGSVCNNVEKSQGREGKKNINIFKKNKSYCTLYSFAGTTLTIFSEILIFSLPSASFTISLGTKHHYLT